MRVDNLMLKCEKLFEKNMFLFNSITQGKIIPGEVIINLEKGLNVIYMNIYPVLLIL